MIRTLIAASAVVLVSSGAFALDVESARLKLNVAPGQFAKLVPNDLPIVNRGLTASTIARTLNGGGSCKDLKCVVPGKGLSQPD